MIKRIYTDTSFHNIFFKDVFKKLNMVNNNAQNNINPILLTRGRLKDARYTIIEDLMNKI